MLKKMNSFLIFAFILGWKINITVIVPPMLPFQNWFWRTPCFPFNLFPLMCHNPAEINTGVTTVPTYICTLLLRFREEIGWTHKVVMKTIQCMCDLANYIEVDNLLLVQSSLVAQMSNNATEIRSWVSSAGGTVGV